MKPIATIQQLESRAFQSYAARPEDLAVFRVILALFVLLFEVPIGAWLPRLPGVLFYPPLGPAALFTSLPTAGTLTALNLLLTLFAALLLIGWHTRVASFGTGLTLLVLNAWEYSLGKIDHDILLVAAPLVLGFSSWGRALTVDAIRRPPTAQETEETWPLALFALLIGFSMFSSGWAKANSGWLSPQVPCAYGHLLHNSLSVGRDTWLAGHALRIQSLWFWKLADWSVVAVELALLPAILHRRAFCIVAGIATSFHLGVLLLMDIPFASNVLAYGAFIRYSDLPGFRRIDLGNLVTRKRAAAAFLIALAVGVAASVSGKSASEWLGIPFDNVVVWLGAVVAVNCFVRRQRVSEDSGYLG